MNSHGVLLCVFVFLAVVVVLSPVWAQESEYPWQDPNNTEGTVEAPDGELLDYTKVGGGPGVPPGTGGGGAAIVPEPGTIALVCIGLLVGLIGFMLRRRR